MWIRIVILAIALSCSTVQAAIRTALDPGPAAVSNALQLATAGDTVEIPAGSSNWTYGITWVAPANVTIRGAGTAAIGGGGQTIIKDYITNGTRLLSVVATNGGFRLSGISFWTGNNVTSSTVTNAKDSGTIMLTGPGSVRVDHCHFYMTNSVNYKALALYNGAFGVLDNSLLDFTDLCAIYAYNGRSGSWESQGNLEWTQPTDFGGTNYFFVEDNIITGAASPAETVYSTRVFDGFTAAKMVIRFNTLVASCLSENHATGHAPNDRGPRSIEIYGNLVTSPLAEDPNYNAVDIGSGTQLVWGNSWDQVYKNIYLLRVIRYAGQSGGGTYNQTATPDGWGYAGTTFNGVGSSWDGGTALGTATTTGYPCLDQPGRGRGALLTNDFPDKLNFSTGTLTWPTQELSPIYIFKNVGSIVGGWGGSEYANSAGTRIVADRDYYAQASGIQTTPTSPFDGTSGTGWGTLANRPTTCTAGVAYWATDQGSWNQSTSNPYGVQQNGADGVLYKATAADTWTLYYEPYTYPHPLIAETDDTPIHANSAALSGSKVQLSGSKAVLQ
jgi:hypothetical protein